MKILHVITSLNLGGAETMLYRFLAYKKCTIGSIAVISLLPPNYYSKKIQELNIQVIHLDIKKKPFLSFRKYISFCFSFRPDVIHCWMYHANIFSLLLKPLIPKVKIIWGVRHSLCHICHEKRATRWIIKLSIVLSRFANMIVYNSSLSKVQHEEYGFCDKSSMVVSNGFFPELYKPSKQLYDQFRSSHNLGENTRLVGIFARYHPIKNYSYFAKISKIVKEGFIGDVRFVMAGTNIDTNNKELAKIIQAHSLENDVILLGRVDSKKHMPALDVILSTSLGEAFSNSIAESMLCGVPCVATGVGDSARVVGDNDFVFEVDDELGMSNKVIDVLSMLSDEYNSLSLRAREHIKNNFSMEKCFNQYKAIYQSERGDFQCVE